jgi:hypothetical protein
MISIALQEALNLLAIRRARTGAVAITSVASMLENAQPISKLVRLHKVKIELEDMHLAAQNTLLDDEKVGFVFYLTDSDARRQH